jgi:hypothetical protein
LTGNESKFQATKNQRHSAKFDCAILDNFQQASTSLSEDLRRLGGFLQSFMMLDVGRLSLTEGFLLFVKKTL